MASIFGTALRNARKENNLTQAEFANLLGIGLMTLQRYEQGTRRPSAEMLERIRQKSGIDLSRSWLDDFQMSLKDEPLSRAAAESLSIIQELNPEGQDAALYTLRMISRIPEFRKDGHSPGSGKD